MSSYARRVAFLAIVLAGACSETPDALSVVQPRASTSSTVSVTSTSPTYGDQGQTSEQVTINGSGFAPGAQAAWALNGVVTSDVQVVSTQYVSSKQLVATVNIASGATLALYDVQVMNTSGAKGIGSEIFEVSEAFAITALESGNGTNDNGQVIGNLYSKSLTPGDAALWTPSAPGARTGTITDLGSGSARPEFIDQAGTIIVGEAAFGSSSTVASYWQNTGSGWTTAQPLPHDATSTGGYARGLASDPSTGIALWVGGQEGYSTGKAQPRMWSYNATSQTFTRHLMPVPTGAIGGRVRGVNVSGQGVGAAPLANGDYSAAYWDQTGAAVLLPPGGNSSEAYAITPDGTTIVGTSNGVAVYWSNGGANSAGTFSGPYALPGTCQIAVGVDASARIIGRYCTNPSTGRTQSAVWVSPYTTVTYLPGLGDKTNAGQVNAISPSGNNISGQASGYGTVWKVF